MHGENPKLGIKYLHVTVFSVCKFQHNLNVRNFVHVYGFKETHKNTIHSNSLQSESKECLVKVRILHHGEHHRQPCYLLLASEDEGPKAYQVFV